MPAIETYHDVVKGRLEGDRHALCRAGGEDVKVFGRHRPVMEKPLAEKAGIGLAGQTTNLSAANSAPGSFSAASSRQPNLELDEPERDHCGSSGPASTPVRPDACPGALSHRRATCISYLTIEHKGSIAPELRPLIGNRIYGCDDCLAACPWNKFARSASEMKLQARDDLKETGALLPADARRHRFRAFFSGSPVKRIGRDRFVRNALIAAGNSGEKSLTRGLPRRWPPIVAHVRGWRSGRFRGLISSADLAVFARQCGPETMTEVLAECKWRE